MSFCASEGESLAKVIPVVKVETKTFFDNTSVSHSKVTNTRRHNYTDTRKIFKYQIRIKKVCPGLLPA